MPAGGRKFGSYKIEAQEFTDARIKEAQKRAELFDLKIGELSGELISRKEILQTFGIIFTTWKRIVLQSKLSQQEKVEMCNLIADWPVMLASCGNKKFKGNNGTGNVKPAKLKAPLRKIRKPPVRARASQ